MPSVFIAEGSPHLNIQVLISGPALLRLVESRQKQSTYILPPCIYVRDPRGESFVDSSLDRIHARSMC
jgi:hypothetical protein